MRTCIWILLLSGLALQAQDKTIKRVAADPTPMASGQAMFHAYCATCHGADARGGGPAAVALKKSPADLTLLSSRHGGKYPDTAVMATLRNFDQPAHGSSQMPVWGPVLRSVSGNSREVELRISNIVTYLGSIQAK